MKGGAELPNHILDTILEKLRSSIDYLQFGLVCKSWHRVMIGHRIRHNYDDHQIPMLLFPIKKNIWQLYNCVENKFLEPKLEIPHNRRFTGSSAGWLAIVNKGYTITLYRPCFGENNNSDTISLPSLFPPHLDYFDDPDDPGLADFVFTPPEFHVLKTLVTADPLWNPEECVIATIFGEYSELAFIRHAKDTSWTRVQGYKEFEDMTYHHNRIYAVTHFGAVVCFDIPVPGDDNPVVIRVIKPEADTHIYSKRYLATMPTGELLQVLRHLDMPDMIRRTEKFQVFKFLSDKEWEEVESLGGIAIFLGDSISTTVLASDFLGCQPNCIYFTHDKDYMINPRYISDLGIYQVESKRFNLHFNIDSRLLLNRAKRPPIWILPNLNP